MVIGKLCCGACQELLKENEAVILGEFNTVAHVACFRNLHEGVKDQGAFIDIINKYDFFKQTAH